MMSEKPVGYRSPPVWTRFKPGVSGNPNGRPPKQKPEVAGVIREFLDAPTEYRENGRVKTASRAELLCRVLIEGAIKGSVPAAERLVRLRMGAHRFGNVGDGDLEILNWLPDRPGQTAEEKTREFAEESDAQPAESWTSEPKDPTDK